MRSLTRGTELTKGLAAARAEWDSTLRGHAGAVSAKSVRLPGWRSIDGKAYDLVLDGFDQVTASE